ncbi:MAG: hypothetical protein WA634_06715 [Silvibacterium sp.]
MKIRGLRQSLYLPVVLAMVSWAASAAAATLDPGFTISGTPVTAFVGPTVGNNSTITITPVDGFTGSVTLTAAVTSSPANAVAIPTLSFVNTNVVSITGSNAETATLAIFTTAPVYPCAAANSVFPKAPWYTASGAAFACILIFSIPARRRSWRTILGILFLFAALTSGTLACGGAQMTGHACPQIVSAGTTPGAYTITVTGASGTTTATGTVSLTVTVPTANAR